MHSEFWSGNRKVRRFVGVKYVDSVMMLNLVLDKLGVTMD